MSDDKNHQKDELEKEIRSQQKFSMAGAIGRAGGGGMLKGASPIPRREQASNQIVEFIKQNCPDPSGAIKSILSRRVKNSGPILENHLENPNQALVEIIQAILDKESALHEFVRQVDVRWGEIYQERPHFQQPGQTPHADDEYTHTSVREDLASLMQKVQNTQ
jgi:hypothetical protein